MRLYSESSKAGLTQNWIESSFTIWWICFFPLETIDRPVIPPPPPPYDSYDLYVYVVFS